MPGPIVCVTHTVGDLASVEAVYTRHLHHRVAARGTLGEAEARLWQAPAMAGKRYLLLQPTSGARCLMRFIEDETAAGFEALKTHGWNATEILVADVDALAAEIAAAGLTIIGEPKNLSLTDLVRAMQILGPAGEVLYFTQVKPGLKGWELKPATHWIERVFICVVGGPDMEAMRQFYERELGVVFGPAGPARISVLSNALGIDPETRHPLATAGLPEAHLIEADEYPAVCGPRLVAPGHLPPGMAMVSFSVKSLPEKYAGMAVAAAPYDGKRACVLKGAAGELIELIEG
jgi:catechol 2,3-dioxygenase-like lactoylglutathione lyase family enzyme